MPASLASGYSIIEPHPTTAPTKSVGFGRGGAANYVRAPLDITPGQSATGPAARASIVSLNKPRQHFASGRGGAGNYHSANERAIFSFDEELEREMAREKNIAPVYHVGRGGAGNVKSVRSSTTTIRRDSDSSASSNMSSESGADIATRKLKESWKKMVRSS